MTAIVGAASPARERLERIADALAVAAAMSLPWSTSATSILVGLWLVSLIPTIDLEDLREVLKTPAGFLPVALVVAAGLGLLWANVPLAERWSGITPFAKLAVLPVLFVQFRRSARGIWVLAGFLVSCVALLAASLISMVWADLYTWKVVKAPGVVVKDYLTQSGEFIVCGFVLLYLALDAYRARRLQAAAGYFLLAVVFFGDVLFIATGRTTLLIMPILLLIFALRQFRWKATLAVLVCGIVVAAAVWSTSSYIRKKVYSITDEVELYRSKNEVTSAGLRIAFWTKSIVIVSDAPVFGHGTGSIRATFEQITTAGTGASSIVASNPHNQVLMVAIQLGLVGVLLLVAMWLSHALLFWQPGLAAWAGLVLVLQNVLGSVLNSHLFDFTQGWLYVLGVGAAGGMLLRRTVPMPAMPLSPVKASAQR